MNPLETLQSEKHIDGLWHAVYPTATKTLCARGREPRKRGRPGKPTCRRCLGTARIFNRIDGSAPPSWFPSSGGGVADLGVSGSAFAVSDQVKETVCSLSGRAAPFPEHLHPEELDGQAA